MISARNQTIFKNRKSIKELYYQVDLIYKYYDSTIKNNIELIDACENELAIRSSKINKIFFEAGQSPIMDYGNGVYTQKRLITQEIPWFIEKTDLRTIKNIENQYLAIIGIYEDISIVTLIINTILYPVRGVLGLPAAFVKFLLNAIRIEFSNDNKVWKPISAFINFTTWLATVLPLWEKISPFWKMLKTLLHL